MHPISQVILTIVNANPDYSLEILKAELFSNEKERLVSRREARKHFGVCEKTLDVWLKKYPNTSVKIGGTAPSCPRRVYIDRLADAINFPKGGHYG